MNEERRGVITDRSANNRLETLIGGVLRSGTIASTALFTIGLVMALAGYRAELAALLLNAALIILLATPATRVVVSVIEYIRERDWTFVVLTLVVLAALAGSVAAAYLPGLSGRG